MSTSRQRLEDETVKTSIDSFLTEADKCARSTYGFAAMSLAFSVILVVSEAVYGTSRVEPILLKFVPVMNRETPWSDWLVTPNAVSSLTDNDVAGILYRVRNELVHIISLRTNIGLENNLDEAKDKSRSDSSKYYIAVSQFVLAVKTAINYLITQNQGKVFDPSSIECTTSYPQPSQQRGAAAGSGAGSASQ